MSQTDTPGTRIKQLISGTTAKHRRLSARFRKQGVQSAASQITVTVIIDDAFRCLSPEQQAKFEALCARGESKWFMGYWGDDPDAVVA